MFGYGNKEKCDALDERIEKIDDRLIKLERKLAFAEGKKTVVVRMGYQGENWSELLEMAKANGYEYSMSTDVFFGIHVEFKKKEEKKNE